MNRVRIFAVPEHYLDVINTEYYLINEIEDGVDVRTLPVGGKDGIQALYSN